MVLAMDKYEVCRTFAGRLNHLRLLHSNKTLCAKHDSWGGVVNHEDGAGLFCIECYARFFKHLDGCWDRIIDLTPQAAMLWLAEGLRKGDVNPETVANMLYALVWAEGAHWRINLRAEVANESIPL